MDDLERATITETMYLRKWAGECRDGVLPDEIIVIETVSKPDMLPVTTQRVVTDRDEVRLVNAQADEAERRHVMASSNADAEPTGIDWQQEVAELEKRVERHAGEGGNPDKLAAYRERLARAKKQAAAAAKDEEK